jgi:hypothetical protein
VRGQEPAQPLGHRAGEVFDCFELRACHSHA